MKSFCIWFKNSLKDSGWFSAYVQLLFLIVTICALFLTNLTENIVSSLGEEAKELKMEVRKINFDIQNLSLSKEKIIKEKIAAEEELKRLRKLKADYVSNISDAVIVNIITELKNKYNNSRILNNQLAEMEHFEKWINKWSNEESYIDQNLTHPEKLKKKKEIIKQKYEEEPKFFPELGSTIVWTQLFGEYCRDCDKEAKTTKEIDIFNKERKILIQKDNEYGYEAINSVKITLLPNADIIKVRKFLNNYSKRKLYQKPVYTSFDKWDYKSLEKNAAIMQKNIDDLENDLPNLERELKIFFNNL